MFVSLRSTLRLATASRALVAGALAAAAALALASPLSADTYVVRPGDTLSGLAEQFDTTQANLLALNPSIGSADLLFAGATITVPDAEDDAGGGAVPPLAAAPTGPAAPGIPSAPPPTNGGTSGGVRLTHVVQSGDTLGGLAVTYATTRATILDLNPGLRPSLLIPGMVLVVVDTTAGAAPAAESGPVDSGGQTPSSPAPPAPAPTAPTPTGPAPAAPAPVIPSGTSSGGPRIGNQPVRLYTVVPGDTFSGIAARLGVSQALLAQLNPHVDPDLLFVGATLFLPRNEAAAPVTPGSSGPTGAYLVVAGDSASEIAERFGISFTALQEANRGLDLSAVFVGQQLRMPSGGGKQTEAATPLDAETELTTYIVALGDFAGGIADRHGLRLDDLRRLNPSIDLEIIFAGQVLVVPRVDLPPPPPGTAPAGPAPGLTYTVQPGDTLTAIAAQFGAGTPALTSINPGLNPNLISVGQTLNVPGTVAIPKVSQSFPTDFGDTIEYVAAAVGVTPHTLLANNPGLGTGWVGAGTVLRVPQREGVIVDVRAGDTLQAIAAQFGTTVVALVAAPNNGVIDPNGLIAGQEILIPITTPVFVWPAVGLLTDGFGQCRTADCFVRHRGTDIAQNGGAVLAMAAGVVIDSGGSYCCGLGFFVEIDHGNGWTSTYGHMNGPAWVAEGQSVPAGEPIGEVGTTGFSTGVHLHLELAHNDWLLDALNYLP